MLKRVGLLVLTNFAVMIILSAALEALTQIPAVEDALSDGQFDTELYFWLAAAAFFGFGGAFVSLALSKTIARMSTGAQVIVQPRSEGEAWLLGVVARHAQGAGIGMPEVAIYPSDDVNAFATGMFRNKALVAVSQGLLQSMAPDEIEAVLGHEIAHVANGDMVTLTLIQGVLNTFVIFLSRVIGLVVDKVVFRQRRGWGIGYYATVFVLQLVLGVLATIIVMAFSRWREYRADAGGARLAGPQKMMAALARLRTITAPTHLPSQMRAFGIRGGGVLALFRSHPPLEKRLERLGARPA